MVASGLVGGWAMFDQFGVEGLVAGFCWFLLGVVVMVEVLYWLQVERPGRE
jgi:hypothetical protein